MRNRLEHVSFLFHGENSNFHFQLHVARWSLNKQRRLIIVILSSLINFNVILSFVYKMKGVLALATSAVWVVNLSSALLNDQISFLYLDLRGILC